MIAWEGSKSTRDQLDTENLLASPCQITAIWKNLNKII